MKTPLAPPPTAKIPFWATLLTLIGVMILCGLGTWQVQRLQWKQNLLAQIDALYAPETTATPTTLTASQLNDAAAAGQDYLRGTVTGQYIPEKSFRTGPRVLDDQQGTHLYTPFQLQDGGIVFVNRGWIPHDDQAAITPAITGLTTLFGLFRTPDRANRFTPPHDLSAGIFYHLDPPEIAAALKLGTAIPYILYLEDNNSAAGNTTLPRPVAARPVLKNDHLGYALFWYSMAGVLLVIYALRFLRPRP